MPVYMKNLNDLYANYMRAEDGSIVHAGQYGSYHIKYTLAFNGVRSLNQPYILDIYWYPESGYRKRTATSSCLVLTGGQSDKALARFDMSTCPQVHTFLKSVVNAPDDSAHCIMGLADMLEENSHWITPLIRKWYDLARVPFKEKVKATPKRKPSLFDRV